MSVVNFIPSCKIWSLPQGVSKVVLHTDLNVQRESSEDSQFVIHNLLGCFKWSHIYFMHQFDFPCNFYQSVYPIPIQNNMHC